MKEKSTPSSEEIKKAEEMMNDEDVMSKVETITYEEREHLNGQRKEWIAWIESAYLRPLEDFSENDIVDVYMQYKAREGYDVYTGKIADIKGILTDFINKVRISNNPGDETTTLGGVVLGPMTQEYILDVRRVDRDTPYPATRRESSH